MRASRCLRAALALVLVLGACQGAGSAGDTPAGEAESAAQNHPGGAWLLDRLAELDAGSGKLAASWLRRECMFQHPLAPTRRQLGGAGAANCSGIVGLGAPAAHEQIATWLTEYFQAGGLRRDRRVALATPARWRWAVGERRHSRLEQEQDQEAMLPQLGQQAEPWRRGEFVSHPPSPADRRLWEVTPNGACKRNYQRLLRDRPATKEYLVMAPVGSNLSNTERWLAQRDLATFDFIGIHYGGLTHLNCSFCSEVFYFKGPKWRLIWQVTQTREWQERIAPRYKAVMLADDDLVMTTCGINRVFETFTAYDLLLGQPSLCPTKLMTTWFGHLWQQPDHILRYVTMVEIMAPMFRMDFFQRLVTPTLHNAWTGWGLDWVWPFLLHYPPTRIGVVDGACMLHPHTAESKTGEGSVYAAKAPYSAREEEGRRTIEYAYFESATDALGLPYRPLEVLGGVRHRRSYSHLLRTGVLLSRAGVVLLAVLLAASVGPPRAVVLEQARKLLRRSQPRALVRRLAWRLPRWVYRRVALPRRPTAPSLLALNS